MIKMKQPSLVLHSCDVPGYKYEMWKSWLMPKGASASDVLYWINWAVDHSPDLALKNVIINCHGSPGFLHVGGSGKGIGIGDVAIFNPLKTKTIGKIWIIACEVAKDSGTSHLGTTFCTALANATGCFVIAPEKTQYVNWWFEHISSPYGSIDDYEGKVYEFNPAGGFKMWKKYKSD